MLRPVDIQDKEFEKKIKGYDCDQVDDFLDIVIQDYEALCKENQSLKDRIGLLTKAVEQYQGMESAIEKSLDTAKKNAEDMKRNAELEAQTIISRAKLDAVKLAKQIDDEHINKHREMLAIKADVEAYKARIRQLCSNLMSAVDDIK